jgi:hypothetical protein
MSNVRHKKTMNVAKQDWRLQGQEKYLLGVTLKFGIWLSNNPKNDHDHCEFCSAKFASSTVQETLHEGYSTIDHYHWVCVECFNDFSKQFNWVVIK